MKAGNQGSKWSIETDPHPGGIHITLPTLSFDLVTGMMKQKGQETKSRICPEVGGVIGDPAP